MDSRAIPLLLLYGPVQVRHRSKGVPFAWLGTKETPWYQYHCLDADNRASAHQVYNVTAEGYFYAHNEPLEGWRLPLASDAQHINLPLL